TNLVSANQFPKLVEVAGRAGRDWLVVQVALNVHRQPVGGFVPATAVFFQALHHDPIQVTAEDVDELRGVQAAAFGGSRQLFAYQRADTSGGPFRFLLTDRASHFVEADFQQFSSV